MAMMMCAVATLALTPTPVIPLRAKRVGAGFDLIAQADAKDFRGEASNLFNNVRTPAALVAGATFGACFALQPAVGDTRIIGLLKRFHMLLGVGAFSAERTSSADLWSFHPCCPPCGFCLACSPRGRRVDTALHSGLCPRLIRGSEQAWHFGQGYWRGRFQRGRLPHFRIRDRVAQRGVQLSHRAVRRPPPL